MQHIDDPRVLGRIWFDWVKVQPKKVNLLSIWCGAEEPSCMITVKDENEQLSSMITDYHTWKSFGNVTNASITKYSRHHWQCKWPHAGFIFLFQVAMHKLLTFYKTHSDLAVDFEMSCLQCKLPQDPCCLCQWREELPHFIWAENQCTVALCIYVIVVGFICIQTFFLNSSKYLQDILHMFITSVWDLRPTYSNGKRCTK